MGYVHWLLVTGQTQDHPGIQPDDEKNGSALRRSPLRKDCPWCGYSGEDVVYEHEPTTAFQKWCCEEPSKDLQQYTRTYEAIKVER
jgi:DNA (cytosine-5)-methyltransferase 1